MRSLERVNIRTNVTYIRTGRPYIPSTTLLCEGIIKASFRGQNRALWRQTSGKCMIKYVTSDVDLDLNDGDTVSKP